MYMYLQKQFGWTMEKYLPFTTYITLLHGSSHRDKSFTTLCNYTDYTSAFVYKYYFSHRSRDRCVRVQHQTSNSWNVHRYRCCSPGDFRKGWFRVLGVWMAILCRGSCWKHRVCNSNVGTISIIQMSSVKRYR